MESTSFQSRDYTGQRNSYYSGSIVIFGIIALVLSLVVILPL